MKQIYHLMSCHILCSAVDWFCYHHVHVHVLCLYLYPLV